MQPITIERADPDPPRRPAPAIIGGVVGVVALLIVFAAGSGEQSDGEAEIAVTLPPPVTTTVVVTTGTTTPVVERRNQSTVIPWEEALAGPSLAVEEVTAPDGLAYVAWMGQVGSRVVAVGPRSSDRHGMRGAVVSWSDDGVEWSAPTVVGETGAFGAVGASPVGLVIAVTGSEGHADDQVVVHATRDGFEWVETPLGTGSYPTVAVVGPGGASVFVQRFAPTRYDELLAAVPASVRTVVDDGNGWLTVQGTSAVLTWSHGLELWSAPLADLGLEGLTVEDLWGEQTMAFYTSSDLVTWTEQPAPFGGAEWFAYDRVWGEERAGVVVYADSGQAPRVWWSDDGMTWERDGSRLRTDTPAIVHDGRWHGVDWAGSGPTFVTLGPDDTSHRRRFEVPSGTVGSPRTPSGGPGGLAWTVALYDQVEEAFQPAVPLEGTEGEVVLYDVSEAALLAIVDGVQQRWSVWDEPHMAADLEAGTIQLLTAGGRIVSEFPLAAIDQALEASARPEAVPRSAVMFTPDGAAWGVTELDAREPTAIVALDGGWLVATNPAFGQADPRLYRLTAP